MKHEKRRFVQNVDFITSPGFIRGYDSRVASGLLAGGMLRVITELAVFSFDERSRRMTVDALTPGVTRSQLQAATGFELSFREPVGQTEPATHRELAALRHLDPDRLFTS
jgi:glutaconate CoA-transferase subunit B